MSAGRFDSQRAIDAAKRGLDDASERLAGGLARLVAGSSDERLEQVMRSPIRRVVLDGIFWQMPQHIEARRAAEVSSSIRWLITGRPDGGADSYVLVISNGRCRVTRGSTDPEPRLTVTVDGAEFLRLATGNSDPMRSYFSGKIGLQGDIMLLAKLTALFRMPARRAAPPTPPAENDAGDPGRPGDQKAGSSR
jgi:putative sterol carrier protein